MNCFAILFCICCMKGDLENQKLLWRKENRTTREKARLYSIRVVVNVVVVGFLGGSLYLIYFANNSLIDVRIHFLSCPASYKKWYFILSLINLQYLNIPLLGTCDHILCSLQCLKFLIVDYFMCYKEYLL